MSLAKFIVITDAALVSTLATGWLMLRGNITVEAFVCASAVSAFSLFVTGLVALKRG